MESLHFKDHPILCFTLTLLSNEYASRYQSSMLSIIPTCKYCLLIVRASIRDPPGGGGTPYLRVIYMYGAQADFMRLI